MVSVAGVRERKGVLKEGLGYGTSQGRVAEGLRCLLRIFLESVRPAVSTGLGGQAAEVHIPAGGQQVT